MSERQDRRRAQRERRGPLDWPVDNGDGTLSPPPWAVRAREVAMAVDRAYFATHPRVRQYVRACVEGEFWPQRPRAADGTDVAALVVVTQTCPGRRWRRLLPAPSAGEPASGYVAIGPDGELLGEYSTADTDETGS